jgi:uncharacterized C2H2 Zn-finger protein
MKEKKQPIKLTYEEPLRFDVDKSSLEEHRKHGDYSFDMTCSCGQIFPVPLDFLGNTATCPRCSKQVKIPEEDFMLTTCACGKSLRIPRTGDHGKKCPQCKTPIKLLTQTPAAGVEKSEQPAAEKAVPKSQEPPKRIKTVCINVKCSCGKKLVLPLSAAQEPIKCPQCKNVFKLPEKDFIRMNCSCGMEFKVLRILEGNYGRCPNCGKALKIEEKKA